jgi:hypothetical protein
MSEAEAPRFSASDAALEGFRVIGQHWRVVLGWSLFNLLAWGAMIMVSVVALLIAVVATGSSDAPSLASGIVGGAVYAAGLLLISGMLACGVFRLMLRPEEPAFLHLRVGPDELRNAGLGVVILAVVGMALFVGAEIARGLAPAGRVVQVLVVLAGLAAALWLFLRFCLALPWTFDARRFVIGGAWRASAGHTWALLGMWLLNICVVGMMAVVLWLALFAVTGALTGFEGLFSSLSNAEQMEARPGRYLLQLAVQVVLGPFFTVLSTAPFVAAYRALRPVS